MKKILASVAVIGAVGALAFGASRAFFSDIETSSGNILKAGAIDLEIDNTSWYNGFERPENSWSLADLTIEKFFSHFDLKPGDEGEDTISLHVNNNPAWACAYFNLTEDSDNDITEPEALVDVTPNDGDLDTQLEFAFWADDGDNVLESDETGSLVQGLASQLLNGHVLPLAQPVAATGDSLFGDTALDPETTYYIGKAWCFGDLEQHAVVGEGQNPGVNSGFICSGAGNIGNAAQTDSLVGDINFYAEQSRKNEQFDCSTVDWPDAVGIQVGASLASYTPPTDCNLVVHNGEDLQGKIDGAVSEDVLCLEDGEYHEFIVNKPLTIAGLTNPNSGSAKIVPSSASVQELALITSSDVTIMGLHFDGNGTVSTGSQMAGIQVSPSGADINNVNIMHNIVEKLSATNGNAANKGIQWHDGYTTYALTNSNFKHNVITDITSTSKGGYGVQTVGALNNVAIENNTISNIDGAWEAGIALDDNTGASTTDVSVMMNHIMSGIATLSVQIEANVDGGGIQINYNNLETLLYGGSSHVGSPDTLDAKNNWWGTATPALGTDIGVDPATNVVDFDPFESSAFATY